MAPGAISKKTLRQRVYENLRADIISGDIFPGQNLTLRELSEKYEVSIVPVREALFQLAAEKVIVQRNNRDYRVNTLTPDEFEEIYRIRNHIEIFIARQAFDAHPSKAGAELGVILHAMAESLEEPREFIRLNQQFHFTLYGYGGMPILMDMIGGLWSRIGPYLSIHIELLEDLTVSYEFHTNITNSYLGGTKKNFIAHLQKDLDNSYNALGKLVKKMHVAEDTNFREHIISQLL